MAQASGRWEILLADLALILFVVALGGLVSFPKQAASKSNAETKSLSIAPSQALYRSVEGGPKIGEWLDAQPLDPRATLTIFVDYQRDNASESLMQAAGMIEEARSRSVRVRTVMRSTQRSDIYASLAFDASI